MAVKQVLDDWYERVVRMQTAHYSSARYFGNWKYWLGVPTITLSAIVGTAVFASLQQEHTNVGLQISVGFASVLSAVLAALQLFLGFAERAEKHRLAGAKYGAIGRDLEILRNEEDSPGQSIIIEIKKQLDNLAIESPNNPRRIYEKAGGTKMERN